VTETVTAKTEQTADWLRPTRGRLALAAVVAIIGFLLPQEVPLEWYPLNEPGTDINYLEISCAADKNGDVKIYYNLTRGINELHTIYWPISPTEQTFTYTFPLPDAPITELRVDPVADGGTLHIRQMRIINRRGEEIRRFTRDLFRPQNEIAAITPVADGWKITSTPGAKDPYVRIEMFSPIIPVGKDHRNLLRCLLSTGYLALMLWILLLAVMFTFLRPRGWRDLLPPVAFMALLALLFAPVGNRGLIRNSIHYARYVPPVLPDEVRLEFDLVSSGMTPAHLFWDRGRGVNGEDSARVIHEPHPGLQTLRFPCRGPGSANCGSTRGTTPAQCASRASVSLTPASGRSWCCRWTRSSPSARLPDARWWTRPCWWKRFRRPPIPSSCSPLRPCPPSMPY